MSNADIQRDFELSGLPHVRDFLRLIVECWRNHPELHERNGVPETVDHQVDRLFDRWTHFEDLPDVYHRMSHEALESLRQSRPAHVPAQAA